MIVLDLCQLLNFSANHPKGLAAYKCSWKVLICGFRVGCEKFFQLIVILIILSRFYRAETLPNDLFMYLRHWRGITLNKK